MIQATTNDVIESDEKELMELLTDLKEEVTEDFIDDVIQLEKIIDAFLIDGYLEGKLIVPMVTWRENLSSRWLPGGKTYRPDGYLEGKLIVPMVTWRENLSSRWLPGGKTYRPDGYLGGKLIVPMVTWGENLSSR